MSLANKFGIPESLLDAAKKALEEANEYQKKVQAHMAKKGIKSLNDLNPDQKKKFFNDLDAMHTAKNEEVEPIDEAIPKSTMYAVVHSKTKKIITKGNKADMAKKVKELNSKETGSHFLGNSPSKKVGDTFGEEVESVEEAESHQAKTTMKHIKNPTQGEKDASKKMKSGIAGYRDRIAMLHSAKARGALKKEDVELDEEQLDELSKDTVASYAGKAGRTLGGDIQALSKAKEIGQMSYPQKSADQVKATLKKSIANRKAGLDRAEKRLSKNEEVELTQEDLDFIASLNQAEVVEGQLRNFSPHSDLAGRGRLSGYNKTAEGKKREADRETERLKDKMKFTKSQGGIAGPKGKLPEEFELDDFTVEEIEEYMQTEEFAQLDELSKETLGSYIKKRQHDVAAQGAITRQHAVDAEKAKKDNNYSQQRKSNEKSDKAFAKGWKYRQNISKAVDKIVNKG